MSIKDKSLLQCQSIIMTVYFFGSVQFLWPCTFQVAHVITMCKISNQISVKYLWPCIFSVAHVITKWKISNQIRVQYLWSCTFYLHMLLQCGKYQTKSLCSRNIKINNKWKIIFMYLTSKIWLKCTYFLRFPKHNDLLRWCTASSYSEIIFRNSKIFYVL